MELVRALSNGAISSDLTTRTISLERLKLELSRFVHRYDM